MPVKPHSSEEEYFAKEEALKKQKLALEQQKKLIEAERKEIREAHWMHCPKCGMNLDSITYKGIELDRCFHCGGTWFDAGEMEKLGLLEEGATGQKGGVVKSILGIFGGK